MYKTPGKSVSNSRLSGDIQEERRGCVPPRLCTRHAVSCMIHKNGHIKPAWTESEGEAEKEEIR